MTQMEELLEPQCDMELMKAAMLKHEETFRQQVHDLHRLYRIQRQLMSDLTRRPSTVVLPCQQGQRRRQHPRWSELSLQLPDDEPIVFSAGTGRQVTPPSRGTEDELELTLAVGAGNGSSIRSQRRRRESIPSATDKDGSTPSSSTDSNGALNQRAMACDLREGMVAKQTQWRVQCLSLRMA